MKEKMENELNENKQEITTLNDQEQKYELEKKNDEKENIEETEISE